MEAWEQKHQQGQMMKWLAAHPSTALATRLPYELASLETLHSIAVHLCSKREWARWEWVLRYSREMEKHLTEPARSVGTLK